MKSTERFSSRVDNYASYRPDYPPAVLGLFRNECQLTPASVIADIGSGTGILSELFLKNGNIVLGVEPNRPMRQAAERLLAAHSRFQSITGTAEATSLPDRSVDMITAGQAFHWFDPDKARVEFKRILRPHGWVALLWNVRDTTASAFARAYEDLLLSFGTDYKEVSHKHADPGSISRLFGSSGFKQARFPNRQECDFAGLQGRLLSSSYIPDSGDERHPPMMNELKQIFESHATAGQVAFDYETQVFYGRLVA